MPFTAKYNGVCAACPERIHDGDLVTYNGDDELVHVDCADAVQPERKTITCPDCWMVKPCRCDD